MSDSLRDQLLKAGFAEPAKPKASKKKTARKHRPQAGPQAGPQSRAPQGSSATGSAANRATATDGGKITTEPKAGHTHVPATPPKKKKSKKAPAIKPRAGSWSTRDPSTAPTPPGASRATVNADPAAAEQRRKVKAAIQTLIDTNALKDFKGEEIYRFTLQNKIRELLVTDVVRKQLANAELAITRLNGATRLVPAAVAHEIREINPQWVIFLTTDKDSSVDEDEEFPIPDDLIW